MSEKPFSCRRCPNCGSTDTIGRHGGYLDGDRNCTRCHKTYSPREERDRDAESRGEPTLFRGMGK